MHNDRQTMKQMFPRMPATIYSSLKNHLQITKNNDVSNNDEYDEDPCDMVEK